MKPPIIVVLNQVSVATARQLMTALPGSQLYGLIDRTIDVDVSLTNFGDTVRQLYRDGVPIVGLCATGILIRTLAPILSNTKTEPPVIAVAADGSAVVPLLGGITGVNDLAEQIATALNIHPAITTTGKILFNTVLPDPPAGYRLLWLLAAHRVRFLRHQTVSAVTQINFSRTHREEIETCLTAIVIGVIIKVQCLNILN